MIKVCILQNGLAWGGTDTFVINLCKGIDRKYFDVTVVNTSHEPKCVVRETDILTTKVKLMHTSSLLSVRGKLRHFIQLYKILRKGKFDVFHTNIDLFNGPNLLIAKLAGVPIRCCHSHNSRQNKEQREGLTMSIRLYQMLMRRLCWHFSNRRCGCSVAAMNFLFKGYSWNDNSYPQIISNGIDLGQFSNKIDVEKKKRELGIPDGRTVLTIGHLIEQKNPLFTAKMFVDLCRKDGNYNLLWIGDGKLKDQVVKILETGKVQDKVLFLKGRNDIAEIMQCADIFILPSSFEGLGIVAIEAQAAGLPCILSDQVPKEVDCGGVVFHSIDNGVDLWTNAIIEICKGHIKLETDQSKLDQFSIENMVKQMSQVYKR